MKQGLNRKDQVLCAKWFTAKVPAEIIAKKLGTTVGVVNRFTPEKQAKAKDQQAKRAEEVKEQEVKDSAKARVLSQVMADNN